ncbi:hypothetical protein OH686_16130 [Pseudomonas sp. SO81]|nr:hypothetical protein OH686_16130 [Pseudomonas sp. SO81]
MIWVNHPRSAAAVVAGGLSHWAICRSDSAARIRRRAALRRAG